MTSRWRRVKADRHCSRQRLSVLVVVGPGELFVERVRDVVEVQGRVEVVPAEHLERRQVGLCSVLGEVGEADLPLVALAVVGNEEQIVRRPGRALGAVGRGALLEHDAAQDTSQSHDGQPLGLELDEEDAPGLARGERAQPFESPESLRRSPHRCPVPRACSRRSAPRSPRTRWASSSSSRRNLMS